MSNGRDFAALDKALREQQRKKAAVAVAAKKPAESKVRYMDMVHPRSQVHPLVRGSSAGKLAAASKPKAAGTVRTMEPTRRVGALRKTDTVKRSPELIREKAAATKLATPANTAATKPEVRKFGVEETLADVAVAKRPDLFDEDEKEAPDANSYSLGGRSPFLTDAKVDKRPLGPNVPESNAGAIRSTKNVYSQRTPLRAGRDVMPERSVITVAGPKKRAGWLWALVTVGVIAAGGGIGLVVYMIFTK